MPGPIRRWQSSPSARPPVYCDVDAKTLNTTAQHVADQVGPATRAVIATHLYGRMAPMSDLRTLADQAGIALLEDCAQAHGASISGVRAGAWGDAAAFSFYPTKNLGAMGDGGAVTTRRSDVADKVKQLRQYGWGRKYHAVIAGGRNSRLDELQASVLRVKLPYLDVWNRQRRAVARCYADTLRHPGVVVPDVTGSDYVAHLFVIRTAQRDALRALLTSWNIPHDIHYPRLDYQQEALGPGLRATRCPEAEAAVAQILSLPCYPELELTRVREWCDVINHLETE